MARWWRRIDTALKVAYVAAAGGIATAAITGGVQLATDDPPAPPEPAYCVEVTAKYDAVVSRDPEAVSILTDGGQESLLARDDSAQVCGLDKGDLERLAESESVWLDPAN